MALARLSAVLVDVCVASVFWPTIDIAAERGCRKCFGLEPFILPAGVGAKAGALALDLPVERGAGAFDAEGGAIWRAGVWRSSKVFV